MSLQILFLIFGKIFRSFRDTWISDIFSKIPKFHKCHLISHSLPHLTPLTLSPSHGRPSGQVRDTSPLLFCKKTPHFYLNSNPFTKSQTYIRLSLYTLIFFFLISTQVREALTKPSPSSNWTLAPRTPQALHLQLKLLLWSLDRSSLRRQGSFGSYPSTTLFPDS